MRNKKRGPEARLNIAQQRGQTALGLFEAAAVELEEAAAEAGEVTNEVEVEVVRLTTVRDDAYRKSAAFSAQAERIREFING